MVAVKSKLFIWWWTQLFYVHPYIRVSFCIIDCGTPAKTGYAYTSTTGTTFGETSSVACADGYEGTISASTVTCESSGTWTDVTGCTIKGGGKYDNYTPAKEKSNKELKLWLVSFLRNQLIWKTVSRLKMEVVSFNFYSNYFIMNSKYAFTCLVC